MKGTIWRAALTILTMAPLAAASASGQPDPVAEMTARAQNTMLLAVDAEIELLEALVEEGRLAVLDEHQAYANLHEAYRDRGDARALRQQQVDINEAHETVRTLEATLTAVRLYSTVLEDFDSWDAVRSWSAASIAQRRADYYHRTLVSPIDGQNNEQRRTTEAIEQIGAAPLWQALGSLSRALERRAERKAAEKNEVIRREHELVLYTEANTVRQRVATVVFAYDAAADALDAAARELAAQGL